jgi:hypothetical protein
MGSLAAIGGRVGITESKSRFLASFRASIHS